MKIIGLILLISSIIACQSETKKRETPDTLTYQYDSVKVYSKMLPLVNKIVADTTVATLKFPVFKNHKIDSIVQENALKSDNPDEPVFKDYKEQAAAFIKNFDDFQKENKDYIQSWYKTVNITVLKQRKEYLGLKYFFMEYAGGAHPNTVVIYKNYNPITLQEITLDSIIPPVKQAQLTAIAERIFRENEKLGPYDSLNSKYFFDKDIFTLNNNFTINDRGLKFLYNSYEIKPYFEGRTELLIPFTAIKELIIANPALPEIK